MTQADLSQFSGAADDRPEAEAVAVAGDASQAVSEVIDASELKFPDPDGTVDLTVTQVDYTVEGQGSEEYPVVHLFGRTPDGTAEHVRVLGFEPYFYAPTASLDDDDLDRDVITRTETGYESIRGEELTKICTQTPRDVGQIRDEFDHFEADILFPNRLLIDKDIGSGVRVPVRRLESGSIQIPHDEIQAVEATADLRVNTFDIEVDDRSGFPEDGEEPIVCLTSHDSGSDEYITWLYEAPEGEGVTPDDLAAYEGLEGDVDAEVRAFDSEAAMLDAFLTYIEDTDPDVLTGWNFEDFDAPYFIDRLEVLGKRPDVDRDLNPNRLSRIGEVWRSDWGGPTIKGRVVFDLLYAYKRTQFTELESYRLDAVGEQELGAGKERYTGDIGDLWEDDPQRLLEYNLRDVELCVELDRKRDIISFWDEVRTFVGCKLEDAPTPGDAVDVYVLHKVHGNFALPSKGRADAEDYEGGAVFDPITGIKENVSVLDLKSLYPMCMVTINASPETKVDPEAYDGDTYRAPNGTHFQKEPDGVIREMVDELLKEREQKKAERNDNEPGSQAYEQYDREQQAVKVIMNSLYGVLGWDRFRLYDREMGAAVTATGRDVIEHTQTAANDVGYEVAYGDTDSVMLELGDDVAVDEVPDEVRESHPEMSESGLRQIAGAIETGYELEESINDSYDEFALEELNAHDHRFQIEFEKLYRRFFQAGKKKRYAGHIVWKEGKHVDDIDITGFEYKRSDIAPITKEVQRQVIEMIVKEDAVDEVEKYLEGIINRFQEQKIDAERIGIPGGIGQRLDEYDSPSAHIRGAKYANAVLNTNFDRGSKPRHLYLERVLPQFFEIVERENSSIVSDADYREFKRNPDIICFEYPDQVPESFEIDYQKMLEKTLEGPISRITESLGISWEHLVDGEQQTGLGHYM